MTKDRKLKQSTLKLTGPLQVRRGYGRVVWLSRLARIISEVFMVGKAGKVCTAA